MDENRRFRLLVAPILFYISVAWGALLDRNWHPCFHSYVGEHITKLLAQPIAGSLVALAGGGITLFASGWVIGTITYSILRTGFMLRFWSCWKQHEVRLNPDNLSELHKNLNVSQVFGDLSGPVVGEPAPSRHSSTASFPGNKKECDELYIGVTFDHYVLFEKRKGVHEWLARRWAAFAMNCTSVTGLVLSLIVGYFAGIQLSPKWWFPVIISATPFAVTAFWAWRDTMGMLNFQAKLPWPKDVFETKGNEGSK